MAVWNLGSINVDLFYAVPHLPSPGETLASTSHSRGLGGKGANISVAVARAGARVYHLGAIGADGIWTRDLLLEYGVDTQFILTATEPTGHAIIATDDQGENNIILFPGANRTITQNQIGGALSQASSGDWFVCQNETNAQAGAARLAKDMGLKIAYVAAPFDPDAVSSVLPFLDLLILNEVEAEQLQTALGKSVRELGLPDVIVTLGSEGAKWLKSNSDTVKIDPIKVLPIDTTGAGDTFAGYVIACLDRGFPMAQALTTANTAAAIMVTRQGTADVIPDLKNIEEFRGL